jgi:hypothetical protein
MTMMKLKAAKKTKPAAAASRARCLVLTARPGTCIFFLARQMSRSAACPAPRRKKCSEQTIYDAATREVLQIDFPLREKRWRRKIRAAQSVMQNGMQNKAGKGRILGAVVPARRSYFRRNRLEISPETERNTSTASAPIMQKAIIILSGLRLTSIRNKHAGCQSCALDISNICNTRAAGRMHVVRINGQNVGEW